LPVLDTLVIEAERRGAQRPSSASKERTSVCFLDVGLAGGFWSEATEAAFARVFRLFPEVVGVPIGMNCLQQHSPHNFLLP
jgi:hypothetical protein